MVIERFVIITFCVMMMLLAAFASTAGHQNNAVSTFLLLLTPVGLHNRLRTGSAATAARIIDHNNFFTILFCRHSIQLYAEYADQQNNPKLNCSLIHLFDALKFKQTKNLQILLNLQW